MTHISQIDARHLPEGTYLNTGRIATSGLRINRFCYDLKDPANRAAWQQDPQALMDRYGVAAEDRALIAAHDWLGLVKRGANVFVLLRLSNLCGYGLSGTGAQMRGQSLEEYLSTRDVTRAS